jgi:hypothetical protein
MTNVKKKQICIKFSFRHYNMAAETYEMLKEAFNDNSLGLTETCK